MRLTLPKQGTIWTSVRGGASIQITANTAGDLFFKYVNSLFNYPINDVINFQTLFNDWKRT